MFDTIKGVISAFKVYILMGLAIFVFTAWLFDRHSQYEAGVSYCRQEEAAAQAEYSKRKEAQYEQEKTKAVKEAVDAVNHLNSLNAKKVVEVGKTNALNKKYPSPIICDLASDELRDFNSAIESGGQRSTNKLPSGKPRTLPKPAAAKQHKLK